MRALTEPKSRVEADLSPSRATATILNAAPDARYTYTTENLNSGGGRTEETSDRVNQQQIDRSRNSNRTRARGTEIAAGTTSAEGWTTVPAERKVAAVEMRVGQNGGPLPFEASFDFGNTIINGALATKRWIRRTRCTTKGVFCNKGYVIRKSWNILLDKEIVFLDEEIIFLGKENRDGGANNLVFQSRGTSTHSKGNGRIDGRATFGWVSVARDRRRERSKHQLKAASLFRAGRLAVGLEEIRRSPMASSTAASGQIDGRATFGWVSVAQDRRRERPKHQPTPALLFRAGRLAVGLEEIRRSSMASSTGDRRRERPKHQPTPALLFRAGRLAVGLEEIRRSSMASSTAANAATQKGATPVKEPMTCAAP